MAKNGSKVFVNITNMQIYKELMELKSDNEIKHVQIMKDMELKHNALLLQINNYQSKMANLRMALGGIGLLTMTTLGFLVNHLLK